MLTLCSKCARSRGARTGHASRYEERADVGVWRGICDDCGRRGSSGDASGIAVFRVVRDDAAAIAVV